MRILASLLALSSGAFAATPPPTSLAWILDQHTLARGGRDAIEAVHSIQMDVMIEEPTYSAAGRYAATRDGSMRIDVYIGGERVFTAAARSRTSLVDGAGRPGGSAAGSDARAAALRHAVRGAAQSCSGPARSCRVAGIELDYAGRLTIEGVDYYAIEATLDDGVTSTTYYLNPSTWLIERERQQRALHVDNDPTPECDRNRIRGLPCRRWRAVLAPAGGATGRDGRFMLATTTVRRITVNSRCLDPAQFQQPSAH